MFKALMGEVKYNLVGYKNICFMENKFSTQLFIYAIIWLNKYQKPIHCMFFHKMNTDYSWDQIKNNNHKN